MKINRKWVMSKEKPLSQRQKVFFLLLLIPTVFLCKVFQYTALSEKYFIDSNKILELMKGRGIDRGVSYTTTANFFNFFNVFKLDSLMSWSILITTVLIILIILILKRYKNITISDFIFIYSSAIILSIFSFNLSKEVLQLLIFLFIYLVFVQKNMKLLHKIILVNVVLLFETLFFREYYILLLLIFNISVFVFALKKPKKVAYKVLLIFIVLYACFFMSSILFPSYYKQIILVRDISERALYGTNTLIKNIFNNNGSFISFISNYTINFFRIIFPIELTGKGLIQLIFFLYQSYLTLLLVKKLKNSRRSDLDVIFLLSYQIASTAFEPDFGSVVRHGSTLFLIYANLKIENKRMIEYEQ